ncbi:MAG: lytic murein transglycosylase, partial [Actinomycetota bacterium]|nr:lytic murein transglycosylase [Actinomycetota bacterium]
MSSKPAGRQLSRRTKGMTLVPLALLSGAWTASLVSFGSTADATPKTGHHLPGGGSVPSKAIRAPANVPVPGAIAPAVPDGAASSVLADASTSGIPAVALSAYQRAGQIIDSADKSCNIPWELIAAIGRVESDHGRYGGNTLTTKGVSTPGIYGPVLDGKNGTQAVPDTDGGQLDKDPVWDRAVGPMQFIPSTWQVVQVDANGDGKRNPQDINDASLATAVYLCSGSGNLGTRQGQEAAVYRYNHSRSYVDLVLRIMEAYSQGNYTAVPSGTYSGGLFSPSYSSTIQNRYHAAKLR